MAEHGPERARRRADFIGAEASSQHAATPGSVFSLKSESPSNRLTGCRSGPRAPFDARIANRISTVGIASRLPFGVDG